MKNKSGVSLITLIITIIVVIILAVIVLRSGASSAPDQANFSKFASEMGELQDAVNLAMLTAKGEEQLKGNQRSEAQLYNFVARGGYEGFEAERKSFDNQSSIAAGFLDDEKWLRQADAETIQCTQIINKDIVEKNYNKKLDVDNFGIELPNRKVETAQRVGQEMAYFVTPKGNVFCWPPYVYDGKSYVNANTTVKSDTKLVGDILTSGSVEMDETTATEIKENGEEYDIIISFENGEYIKVTNEDELFFVDFHRSSYQIKSSAIVAYVGYGDSTVRGLEFQLYANNNWTPLGWDGELSYDAPMEPF